MRRVIKWLKIHTGLNEPAQKAIAIFLAFGCLFSVYQVLLANAVTNKEIKSTVQILVLNKDSNVVSNGSGTIINMEGNILTNHHVIKDVLDNGGWTWQICITKDAKKRADCGAVTAELVGYSETFDLALLQIVRIRDKAGTMVDYEQYAVNNPRLESAKIDRFANVDEGVGLGQTMQILGYPNAGGTSITETKGIVSGFEQKEIGDLNLAWFVKTDAKVNPGSSGGGAFTDKNEFVGVPKGMAGGAGNIGYVVSLPVVNYFLDIMLGGPAPQTGLLCQDLERGFVAKDRRCTCNPGLEWSGLQRKCVTMEVPVEAGIMKARKMDDAYCKQQLKNSYFNQTRGRCECRTTFITQDNQCVCPEKKVEENGQCVDVFSDLDCIEQHGPQSYFNEKTKECGICEEGRRPDKNTGQCFLPNPKTKADIWVCPVVAIKASKMYLVKGSAGINRLNPGAVECYFDESEALAAGYARAEGLQSEQVTTISRITINDSISKAGYVDTTKKEFSTESAQLYISAFVQNAGDGMTFQAKLIYDRTGTEVGQVSSYVKDGGDIITSFAFQRPAKGWTPGNYTASVKTSSGEISSLKIVIK